MSAAANILASLGSAIGTAYPTYSVDYGAPVPDGTFTGIGKRILVHLAQEEEELQTQSLLGGMVKVQPLLIVSIHQPVTSTDGSNSLARAQALLNMAADLRGVIHAWVLSTVTAPISGAGTLVYLSQVSTPATLDMGGNTGVESVTVETRITYTRNAGGA